MTDADELSCNIVNKMEKYAIITCLLISINLCLTVKFKQISTSRATYIHKIKKLLVHSMKIWVSIMACAKRNRSVHYVLAELL